MVEKIRPLLVAALLSPLFLFAETTAPIVWPGGSKIICGALLRQSRAGSDIPVDSAFILGEATLGSYSLVSLDLTGSILQKGLSVTGAIVQGRTHDRIEDTVILGAQLSGLSSLPLTKTEVV